MASRITWRLFNGDGQRIATAVELKDKTLFQVFPDKQNVENEGAWKALHPTWEDMRGESAVPAVSKEEAKKQALLKKLAEESFHIKMVRALYDEYCIPNTLTFKTLECKGPMKLYVKLGTVLKPVYFNRKRGLMSLGVYKQTLVEFPSEPLTFFVKVRDNFHQVPVPAPLPTDKKTVILFREKMPHSSDTYSPYCDAKSLAVETEKAESQGFHVKVIRRLGHSTSYYPMHETLWSIHPQVERIVTIHAGWKHA